MRNVSVGAGAPESRTRRGKRTTRAIGRSWRLVAVVVVSVAAVALAVLAPAAALASTCTDSWKHPVSGLWTTGADWSTGSVPTSSDDVCITTPGNYTVTAENGPEVNSLTLGATSGSETERLLLTGEDTSFIFATSSMINLKGLLEWKPKEHTPGFYSKIIAPGSTTLVNHGRVLAPDASGKDYLKANFTNAPGAIFDTQSGEVIQETGKTFTNEGTFQVDSGALYELFSTNTFVNSGSVIDNGRLYFDGGATHPSWTETGTETGNPVQLKEVDLIDTSGSGEFDLQDEDAIAGMIAAGQTVTSEGHTTILGTVTNHGTLALLAPVGYTRLYTLGGSSLLQNDGAVTSQGKSYFQIPLINAAGATVTVQNGEMIQEHGVTFTNEGTLQVDAGALYELFSTNTFVNDGSVVNNGVLNFRGGASRPSWAENGTETGHAVQLLEVDLTDTSGNGEFNLINEDTIAGMIAAGQTLTSEGYTYISGTVTNHGTLELLAPSGFTKLLPAEGAPLFQNEGVLATEGKNYLEVPLTNAAHGTVGVGAGELAVEHSVTLTNEGSFEIANTAAVDIVAGSAFTNGSGGTLLLGIAGPTNFGKVTDSGGTFNPGGTIFPDPGTGYTPAAGLEFDVITSLAPISGTFASVANGFEADYSTADIIAVRLAGSGGAAAGNKKAEEEAAAKKKAEEAAVKKRAEEEALAAGASIKIVKVKVTASELKVTVKTSQAGTVTLRGPGLKKTSKTLAAGTHVVTVALTKAGKAARRAHKKIKLAASLKVGIKTVSSSLRVRF